MLPLTALPLYCERLTDGIWSEPLNALSNAALFMAALIGWREWKRLGGHDRPAFWLVMAAALVGAGSLAWHTWRMPETLLADMIPIQIFVFTTFSLVLRRFFELRWVMVAACLAAFAALTVLLRQLTPPGLLAGGANYLPALAMLYLLGAVLVFKARLALHADVKLTGRAAAMSDAAHFPKLKAGYALILAGLVFALSLAARTLDLPVCASFPAGLHFVWHILNGAVIAILLLAVIRHGETTTHQAASGSGSGTVQHTQGRQR